MATIEAGEASAVLEAAGGQAAETFAVDDGGPVLYVAASHQSECIPVSHCLGDVITSIHSAWLWVRDYRPSQVILSLCRDEAWNPLWARFVRENRAAVVWDRKARQKSETYALFDQRRRTRQVEERQFDIYRETYVRTDGGPRQTALCGSEVGLVKRERPLTIFSYNWYGQEHESRPFPRRNAGFGPGVIDVPEVTRSCRVLVSPYSKCMGMDVFTWDFWRELTGRLLEAGLPVTLNHSHDLWDLRHPLLDRRFSTPESVAGYVAGHALAVCGNTGVGWVAAATGTPLLAMQPRDGWIFQDGSSAEFVGEFCVAKGTRQRNSQGITPGTMPRFPASETSEQRRGSILSPRKYTAGWPWAVARPGLPQIRTCTH